MTTPFFDYEKLWQNICKWGRKVGRVAARPVLLLYYVMTSEDTPKEDKAMIFAAIAYLVLPLDLIQAWKLPIIGWLDEGLSIAVIIKKMQKYITPEMQQRANETLDQWFPEYTEFEVVEQGSPCN